MLIDLIVHHQWLVKFNSLSSSIIIYLLLKLTRGKPGISWQFIKPETNRLMLLNEKNTGRFCVHVYINQYFWEQRNTSSYKTKHVFLCHQLTEYRSDKRVFITAELLYHDPLFPRPPDDPVTFDSSVGLLGLLPRHLGTRGFRLEEIHLRGG